MIMEPRHRRRYSRSPRGRQQKPGDDLPILLGEPSPSLAKIAKMNMVKLEEKIVQLTEEQIHVGKRIEKLLARDEVPTKDVESTREQLERLKALEQAARSRLDEKIKRKTAWEQKNR